MSIVQGYTTIFIHDAADAFQTTLVGFVSLTLLCFDHIITFADEVKYIWNRRKTVLTWLFLINRYMMPLGFIIILFAYTSPALTKEKCGRFFRYEGAMAAFSVEMVGVMMLFRIHALYSNSSRLPVMILASLLVLETVVHVWIIIHGEAVPHADPRIHVCSMIFDPHIVEISSGFAWIPLLYDTIVLILTVYKVLPVHIESRRIGVKSLMQQMFTDGILYYSVMFVINGILVLMIIFAPAGNRNITAQLQLVLTTTMMSRLTLSLRKAVDETEPTENSYCLPTISTRPPVFQVDSHPHSSIEMVELT